ncbi:uncharacterized protein E0L32_006060 [Thyridium curvatum]|uniref:Killer toxin Kp4 domain-containing protein n=1 Tax=Thyridium curvatum TaxID=1093900 RepID=A0A507B862_9PEZI|nr:uncharacterized protein E0L32_006060 [Thyridium curvatum]TPX13589.1 hypothetical protein E0L32_006060 [Thyridium curvatum]
MAVTTFSSRALAIIMLVLSVASAVQGLGINCRGSGMCTPFINGGATGNEAKVLSDWIQGIEAEGYKPPQIQANRIYKTGEQIACYERSHICAFLQNTGDKGGSGADVRRLAPLIPKHGCKICGSVPTHYPDSNNVKDGQLTFNYVTKICGNGIC